MEHLYSELREQMSGASTERKDLQDHIEIYKARITELEALRTHLTAENTRLQTELSTTSLRLTTATTAREDERRSYRNELDDMKSRHRDDLDSRRRQAQEETEQLLKSHRVIVEGLERRLKVEIEDERNRRQRDLQEATTQSALDKQRAAVEADVKEMEISGVKRDLTQMQEDLEREKVTGRNLRDNLSEVTSSNVSLESSMRALKAKIEFLESDSQSQAKSFTDLDKQLQDALDAAKEAQEKLRKEETLRRILHNQVQELKGNVRVFCRVRPSLSIDSEEAANILFPDAGKEAKEVEILGAEEKSSLGTITRKKNAFAFDRIFAPNTQNQEVFDEISQLVQSALDGYNVCIFCYGQTGSGKTYTMSAEDGMIPRAVTQIYETAQTLQDKGWSYTMEGSFLEVYNETLNDLLGRAEDFDKKKLEIRHDLAKGRTTVSDLTSVILDTPTKVESLLRRAAANRSVAATKANERSSRSHSVFILRLVGVNRSTGERSEGTLNLVDLAGSERLSQSGATGDRLKETQNINRSLSCLGDVIGALGQGKEGGHVPYRNSKLTYLLQHSLGGNSKTLMFVMISPLQAHLGETLTSLKFATKVHNTHIGTAKRQAKVKE
ncbi:MAG: kinesin-like nuclear fusion protein [Piccolia ochrophora]|nr:MAG: kinesin-like nuclear fusion protein [Piccolia ochrophora]